MGFIFLVKLNSPHIQESIDFRCNQKNKHPQAETRPFCKPKRNAPDEHIVKRHMISNIHHKNWVSTSRYVLLFLVLISPSSFFSGGGGWGNPVSVMPVSNHVSILITCSPDAFIVGLQNNYA